MKTIVLEGKMTSAVVYAAELDDMSRKQILKVCSHPAFEGCAVRIMPDVHAGKGCVIGFTAEMRHEMIVPNLIGVDIGCGVLTVRLKPGLDVDREYLEKLDARMRHDVPHGFGVRDEMLPYAADEYPDLLDEVERISRDVLRDGRLDYHKCSLGTLGGGNHFVEITRSQDTGDHYLHIHSGSRHFGNLVATVYQAMAGDACPTKVDDDLKFLEGELSRAYLRDMRVAQLFAAANRRLMVRELVGDDAVECFDTIHNYISDDNVIRKGAVSAAKGETLLVPLNMRDGSLLCRGKGNAEYNCSSPHGAGRVYSRRQAKKQLSMDDFKSSMEGIYTSCVTAATLDEAPMAYKPAADIEGYLEPTAEIVERLKPVYNFKA